ncbi:hypothetical protein OG506_04750 [Streptomyces sp. NBC_00696]|nr:hypothetical protein [Streptomyces sp. NBC_00696]
MFVTGLRVWQVGGGITAPGGVVGVGQVPAAPSFVEEYSGWVDNAVGYERRPWPTGSAGVPFGEPLLIAVAFSSVPMPTEATASAGAASVGAVVEEVLLGVQAGGSRKGRCKAVAAVEFLGQAVVDKAAQPALDRGAVQAGGLAQGLGGQSVERIEAGEDACATESVAVVVEGVVVHQ